ncbi:MAG TPA: hypothetical protein VFF74_00850 [Methylophilaceae bacterium]|nr:hypothetical protein [Methylophilaceae bacterium]
MNGLKPLLKNDSFSALHNAVYQLSRKTKPLIQAELIELERKYRPHLDILINRYTETSKLGSDDEEHIWLAVHEYLEKLTYAYASAFRHPMPKIGFVLSAKVLLQRLDTLALLSKWYYLRYQPLPKRLWQEMHEVYVQAEEIKAITKVIDKPSFQSRYLQALLLDMLNRSNMLKSDIDMVDRWLKMWCQNLSLDTRYDENRHQCYVDLEEDAGARRIRELKPKASYRYWSTEYLTAILEGMRHQLDKGELPAVFGENIPIPRALRLIEQLLAEWSLKEYKRQRRNEEREEVSKIAQAVHGVLNVCQHVKNLMFANMASPSTEVHRIENGWIIENESKSGFGALVNAEFNLWLKPGCLIALDYELNPEMTVVGVVRNIQQKSGGDCYVGIEVLSHTPSYVRLQALPDKAIVLPDSKFFPALYLGTDEERDLPASVVMSHFDFASAGLYELRTQQSAHHVRLGEILDHQDDWIRVAAVLVPKSRNR